MSRRCAEFVLPRVHPDLNPLAEEEAPPKSGGSAALFAIENLKSKIYHPSARVAKLADAPDLGFRNHRFQNIAFRFKKQPFYERKSRDFREIELSANGE